MGQPDNIKKTPIIHHSRRRFDRRRNGGSRFVNSRCDWLKSCKSAAPAAPGHSVLHKGVVTIYHATSLWWLSLSVCQESFSVEESIIVTQWNTIGVLKKENELQLVFLHSRASQRLFKFHRSICFCACQLISTHRNNFEENR